VLQEIKRVEWIYWSCNRHFMCVVTQRKKNREYKIIDKSSSNLLVLLSSVDLMLYSFVRRSSTIKLWIRITLIKYWLNSVINFNTFFSILYIYIFIMTRLVLLIWLPNDYNLFVLSTCFPFKTQITNILAKTLLHRLSQFGIKTSTHTPIISFISYAFEKLYALIY